VMSETAIGAAGSVPDVEMTPHLDESRSRWT
jgi:hypothetical protein